MADSKISDLTALTSSASDDVLPIVDTSAEATKKMTIENIFKEIPVSVGVNVATPLAKLHVVRDAVSHSTNSSLAPIRTEDDTRPGIFITGNADNIGIIQFGDHESVNAGEIFYAHSDDKFSFRCAGTVQATLANGVFAPETDSDVDLGTSSLYFKDAFIDTITTTGNIKSGGEVQTANIGFTDGDNAIVIVDGGGITASTSLTIAGDGATVTGIKDEDDMSSNSATKLATQQSIKAYVDSTTSDINYNLTKTANYTAVAGDRILCDTSGGAFTITLPASPNAGDKIHVLDVAASFDNNNLTIARNGKKIQSATADLTITTENTGIGLVFYNDTYGWRILVDAYNVDPTEL
ncbi:phage tail fiber-like protein [uncultured Mediterranean phage uvMED]|nr:phage tail fiber-like protein [uncultured Mediterranean phage uvMED]